MFKLSINGMDVDRFSNHIKANVINEDGNAILIQKVDNDLQVSASVNTSIEEVTADLIKQTEKSINDAYLELKSMFIWSINGIKPVDGELYLLFEGNICPATTGDELENGSAIKLTKRYPDTYLLDNRTAYYIGAIKDHALLNIMRYQMCLYHDINDKLHRLLNMDAKRAYGLIPNYIAAKHYYNHGVFNDAISVSVVSTRDGVYIGIGYNNLTSKPVNFDVEVKISVSGYDIPGVPGAPEEPPGEDNQESTDDAPVISEDIPMDYGSAGWLGIYLNQASCDMRDVGDNTYKITRDGIDITDTNKCMWYNASFNEGTIEQHSSVKPAEFIKTVYSISKNPNIDGFVTYGVDCSFSIDVSLTTDGVKIYEKSFSANCATLKRGDRFLDPSKYREDMLNDIKYK